MPAPTISKEELKAQLSTVLLIDVREPDEQGVIGNAQKIPLGRLIRDHQSLPKDKDIIIYCRSGVRGQIAADFLAARGFKVKNLTGGFAGYSA